MATGRLLMPSHLPDDRYEINSNQRSFFRSGHPSYQAVELRTLFIVDEDLKLMLLLANGPSYQFHPNTLRKLSEALAIGT